MERALEFSRKSESLKIGKSDFTGLFLVDVLENSRANRLHPSALVKTKLEFTAL